MPSKEALKLAETLSSFQDGFNKAVKLFTEVVEEAARQSEPKVVEVAFPGFGNEILRNKLDDLIQELEKLPPSTDATNLVSHVSLAAQAIGRLQDKGEFFWPRLTAYASMENSTDGLVKNLVIPVPTGDGSGKAIISFVPHGYLWVAVLHNEFILDLEGNLS